MTRRYSRLALLMVAALSSPAFAEGTKPAPIRKPTLVAGTTSVHAGFVNAGDQGATWMLPGGPRVEAAAGSELRVLPTPQPLTFGPGRAVAGYTVVLRRGKLHFDIPKSSPSAIVLVAPRRLTVIVKSGSASAASSSTTTAISSEQGETSASVGNSAYRLLPAGKVLSLTDKLSSTRDAVGTPTGLRGKRVLVVKDGSAALRSLVWNAVPNAVGYRVQLFAASDTTARATLHTSVPRIDSGWPRLAPGEYQLVVRAEDSDGLTSTKSLSLPVRVLAPELPKGAYVDSHGVIRLNQGQRVGFSNTDGLEMTYSAGGTFVRAANTIGLYRDQPTVAYLRFAGTYDTTLVRLAPRALRARIEMSPRSATWPQNPIQIRIRAENGSGDPVPKWLKLEPRVSLGVEPLDVDFERHGAWLTATVAPHKGEGPWVLRVEVKDQFGNALGRDFVEIIHEPTSNHPVLVSRR